MSGDRTIDLNADLGESAAPDALARDRAIMRHISSCSIACGGHAGDEGTMRAMLSAARDAGVAAGAHPSYPDRANFGRRTMTIAPDALARSLAAQIATLAGLADEMGMALAHVKPHGALYNDAADDPALAKLVVATVREALPVAALFGLANSAMGDAVREAGLAFVGEGFADRRYTPTARLQPRGEPGAVIEDQEERVAQALALAGEGELIDSRGGRLGLRVRTICLHSDSDGALTSAHSLRAGLEAAGYRIAAPA